MKKDHVEHVALADAYDALSQEAFAIWIRLHLFTDDQLNSGRLSIASKTGYSESRINTILRELRLAGYLTFHPSERPGHTTQIKFARVCKISGPNRFVKLSHMLFSGHDEPSNTPVEYILPTPSAQKGGSSRPNQSMGRFEAAQLFSEDIEFVDQNVPSLSAHGLSSSCRKVNLTDSSDQKGCATSPKQSMDFSIPQKQKATVKTREHRRQKLLDKSENRESGHGGSGAHSPKLFSSLKSDEEPGYCQEYDLLQAESDPPNNGQNVVFEKPRRIKFYTLNGGITPASKTGHESDTIISFKEKKNRGLNLSLFGLKSRAKRDSNSQKPKHPDVGKPIDWTRLDQWGKPQITFSPSGRKREQMVAILAGDSRRLTPEERKLKKDMEKKLESEFIRMYERYRRMVLRENGKAHTVYEVMSGERKYALKAAVACIVKGVTPRQVLEYWHGHIGNFADSKMPVPPLTFLSQPANIDTVFINVMSGQDNRPPRARQKSRLPSMHTMSDTRLLHPKLRRALMDEGFDLVDMNDSYLTTIQAYAIDIVSGAVDVRLIPSKIRPMVKWAADHFYQGVNVEDYI